MSEKSKTAIMVALITLGGTAITVGGSIYVAKMATKKELSNAGSQIANLRDQAQSIKTTIDYIATPPGTIVAFGGPVDLPALEKQGWLPCDGREASRNTFIALFAKVGSSWGSGDGVNTFNLPDLRGVFLRGINGDRPNQFPGESGLMDPDVTNRINLIDGGNTKNKVGSYQTDKFAAHSHRPFTTASVVNPVAVQGSGISASTFSTGYPDTSPSTGPAGGNETHPKNAYVHFIIKY